MSREVREFHSPSYGIFFKVKRKLYSRNSPFQKIEVIENEQFGRVLLLDGLVQTTERDEFIYHEMLVHPALLSHPSPRNVLIIGGGDGGAIREVLRYDVNKVWLVEIDAQVIEVSKRFFPWLEPALRDKRAELIIDDGNKFIRTTEEKFDVILIDSSDPVGPSTPLHRSRFYKNLKSCLQPIGAVSAQAGALLYQPGHLREKTASLSRLFRFCRFYTCPVPTYPGGIWCFVFLSDKVNPLRKSRKIPPSGLKYFNRDILPAAFALPNFFRQRLM